jgi:predicted O-linked N-acetylglucosamine transferase (SPINDLY family)
MSTKDIITNYKTIISISNEYITRSFNTDDPLKSQTFRLKAIQTLERLTEALEITDYLLLDSSPSVPRDTFIECFFNLGTLLKNYAENEIINTGMFNNTDQDIFYKSISQFQTILHMDFEHDLSIKQIISIYTQLCYHNQHNTDLCLKYLREALFFSPDNETIHYNLGFVYQKCNKLDQALIHYKLSIKLCGDKPINKEIHHMLLNNYNGISCLYRSIKQWPEALHYLLKAENVDPEDPDIKNQLGVVYTEMRRTDLAEQSYLKAIEHYKKTFISKDPSFFLSEIYLNYGHMHSYNGDNQKAIDNYNKSLQISPHFALPFQNKLMNLSYLFDQLDDKMYITHQHKLVNKLYKKNSTFTFDTSFFQSDKINIGIVSGDFVDHPVSFFISTFLKHYNTSRFNVTCYSECVINTGLFNKEIKLKIIRNMTAKQAAQTIYNDNIHILFDLAGHTAFNRLDVFALKPAPIQITYIGYPFTTGLNEMDYRITDSVCDNISVSQEFYTEKLLSLPNCFLCYDPTGGQESKYQIPELSPTPFVKNNYITFGCFNRLNKITDSVIKVFNNILLRNPTSRFVFKTKALLNQNVKSIFLLKFDESVRSRINVVDCTISHVAHLSVYNQIDIAIDTFPYSGTTTSCEALLMGVPVFSLYDDKYHFHPQNVTCSILKNSHMDFYICNNNDDLYNKITKLHKHSTEFWINLKNQTRLLFLNGNVCNKDIYINNLMDLLQNLYKKHIN